MPESLFGTEHDYCLPLSALDVGKQKFKVTNDDLHDVELKAAKKLQLLVQIDGAEITVTNDTITTRAGEL